MTHRIDAPPPAVRAAEATALSSVGRSGAPRNEPVAATAAVDRVILTGDAEGLQAMGRELGTAPAGIDMARVNALKAAIADGSYAIDAPTIATRMLGLERQLEGAR
ncbi:flagellar biosynthesis anti-sigma factor FlgM [Luteimonas sp. SMYT11W]|uniref:Negative regulator of flagellin synthesis n=1 Tax=Luteimonas flava TaxID=3115822 RepID=A0ABU7WJ86_9GAMM